MKNTTIQNILKDIKILEKQSHVNLDDVINKVTQEVGELIEANVNGDVENTYKEANDVMVNVLSVAEELNLDLDDIENEGGEKNDINLCILNSKWNQKIQGLRGRYSRENISLTEASDITNQLVKEVLNYSDPDLNLGQMLEINKKKFGGRVEDYKNDLKIKDYISDYPDFPKKGIDFKDIGPILKSPEAFRFVCMEMAEKCMDSDVIVGLDSRGFLFGTFIAEYLQKPFVMLRKAGKLPGKTVSQNYGLEYGSDKIELQETSIKKGQKVSIIDDLLATGGTAKAAINLIEKLGGKVDNICFVISLDDEELKNCEPRRELENYNSNCVVSYE